MGRRKQRTDKGKDKAQSVARTTGLEEPWSSSPKRNPRYVLYCYNHATQRQYIINSYALYAIRKIFDSIVEDNEIEPSPLDPDRTITFGEIDIRSEQMNEILNHQYTKEEEAWELSYPYPEWTERFLHGPRMSQSLETDAEGKPMPPKPKAERIDRSKFVTIQTICAELKMEARDARAALRKAKVEKPAGGWIGDEAWAKDITEVLKKAQAADKKGKK